jgi:NADPH:quinone reductase-like Zn-dependent oxidoreductase
VFSEPLQQHTGVLITEWPAIIGSDFSGVVLETGSGCTKLNAGDHVYGCAPVGQNKFTPFQDTFLADEDVILKKPASVSVEEAATVGAGLMVVTPESFSGSLVTDFVQTASLCLLAGMGLKLSQDGTKDPEKDEWIVVLGGSGTVGQYALQIAHACGYKILASCSPSKSSVCSPTSKKRKAISDIPGRSEKWSHSHFQQPSDRR